MSVLYELSWDPLIDLMIYLYHPGVLECRMIGQNKCKTWETMNMVTAPEFFAHYPDLQLFFLRHLEAAQDTLSSGRLQLHPSLFPIISLLSKLGPGVERQREDRYTKL